jgi:hypothetical protein
MATKWSLAGVFVLALAMISALSFVGGCSEDDDKVTGSQVVSSQSYTGHENDADSNYLVQGYPALVGTRLDDCQTCHTGGTVYEDDGDELSPVHMNPCSYCHLIPYPDEAYVQGAPGDYEATLNAFGLAYKVAGRTRDAIEAIKDLDSDGDGYSNDAELSAGFYPGDSTSVPGQPVAPYITYEYAELTAMPVHDQFLLMNSHKQEFDDYARYVGVKVQDILAAAGATLEEGGSITFIAPDGYAKDFYYDEVFSAYPAGLYYADLDPASFQDPGQGFVSYPPADQIPEGLGDGEQIPGEPWLMVAYARDGADLHPSYLDPTSGRLEGEGPYRNIVPQSNPGGPDRGSRYSPSGYDDGWDYDDSKDHNAGLCVRGIVAIRVNPLPEGYEEFDWKNGGFSLLEKKQLLIYGAGIE